MKRMSRQIIVCSLMVIPVSVFFSCGGNEQNRFLGNKRLGGNQALQTTQPLNIQEKTPASMPLGNQGSPAQISLSNPELNTPQSGNSDVLGGPAMSSSSLPYYCDPTRYPPNITENISICKLFDGSQGGLPPGYGYYPGQEGFAPGGLAGFPAGPVGYRLRRHVGQREFRDHDDHRHHRGWSRSSRENFRKSDRRGRSHNELPQGWDNDVKGDTDDFKNFLK